MRGRIAIILILLAATFSPLGARAMNANGSCNVVAGGKYLDSSANEALCREIERAIAAEAPGVRYTAQVKALSPTRLTAKLVVNGKTIPEHNFAVMDADLDLESMKRFARSLAADVAKAVKK